MTNNIYFIANWMMFGSTKPNATPYEITRVLTVFSDNVETREGFDLTKTCYERCANGKGDYKDRGNKKILPIKYTPDFIGKGFIIETKGRANEAFPMRWKLFKHYAEHNLNSILYKPQNQKECD